MSNITDKLYQEWAWRTKSGTPTMDNPEDKAILESLISDLTDKVLVESAPEYDKYLQDMDFQKFLKHRVRINNHKGLEI